MSLNPNNQETLQKLFETFGDGSDDKRLEELIADSDRIMRFPAKTMLAAIGLDGSTKVPFTLLDNACGIGPVAAELQDQIDSKVLAESKLLCADFNASLVDTLKRRIGVKDWTNVEACVLDAQVCQNVPSYGTDKELTSL